MTPTSHQRTLAGIGVCGAVVIAPLFALQRTTPDAGDAALAGTRNSPDAERARLDAGLARACSALRALAAGLDEQASDIIDFQLALAEDDDMLAPAHAAIASGTSAAAAWNTLMAAEVADYEAGDDEVLAGRASDLRDLQQRVTAAIEGRDVDIAPPGAPSIVVADDITPSQFLQLYSVAPGNVAGLALGEGSSTSHLALLARARDVPLVVGLGALPERDATADAAVLDPSHGCLIVNPDAAALHTAEREADAARAEARVLTRRLHEPAVTSTGERVDVMVNIDHPSSSELVDIESCDGCGLVRTEFLFERGAPSEESQFDAYTRLVDWAKGRTLVVRTLDAGGDKPVPGLTHLHERNPFLGVRGLRLSLAQPELLRTQLRALTRAAHHGSLAVMLPMVTEPAELEAARGHLDAVVGDLRASGIDHARPTLGIMVEVPAVALAADRFDADFYSIGTNDLIQYATASARDNAEVAALARGDHPGVLAMLRSVVSAARRRGVKVSVCGDMASDPEGVHHLLEAGVRSLSVAPATLARIKAAVCDWPERASGDAAGAA